VALRLAILADDLTGALDAAAPFAARGLTVDVALHPGAMKGLADQGAQIIAVSTRSRELAPAGARAALAMAVSQLPPGVRLFKKIDSRLKGAIEAELSALAFRRALVVPAIPDFGRIVRDGAVTGFGVPRPLPIAPALGAFAGSCVIPDVASGDDMEAALDASTDMDLLIGARGLAEALARRITGRAEPAVALPPGPRAVFVVGSRDPITMTQVAKVRQAEEVGFVPAANGLIEDLPAGNADLILVQALPGASEVPQQQVAANLARGLHPALTSRCDTLLLTGGATAEAVLSEMGIERLRLRGECLPGLPVAVAGSLTIVAKSGGFGDEATLARVARMIAGGEA
jgi:D-threonate/D-erythronate kinase